MPDKKLLNKSQKGLNNYTRYSGIAFQMGIIIFLGTFGGIKLDKLVKLSFPLFTVLCSFLSVIIAIYVVIKELTSKDKNEQ
jgi:ATP synthase protein I